MAYDIEGIVNPAEITTLKSLNTQINESTASLIKFLEQQSKMKATVDETSKSNETASAKINEYTKLINRAADGQNKLTAYAKEHENIQKQLVQTEAKIFAAKSESNKKLVEQKAKLQEVNKEIKQNIIVTESQKGSYVKIQAELTKNINAYKQLSAEQRNNSSVGGKLLKTIQQQQNELKKLDAQMGNHQRNVGNYGSALAGVGKSLLGAFGIVGGVAMFANVLKDAFNVIRDFTKENAVLAGVLGKERKEIEQLTEQAIILGAVYPITSSEVTQLQISFARLGFAESEIINLTESTIQGSIALNSELDRTATLVGSVVKAYDNLKSSDAPLIVDQLTLATQRSSLSFSSLETALPKIAGAANAMNIPLSKTLALLGLAQDATLDASTSGTALRNIFLELSKRGITLEQALNQIRGSTNKLNTAYELFDKRGAVVALTLANNIDKIGEFTTEIDKAGGTAEKVAKTQIETLDGSIKELEGAWEKAMLSFRNSEGFLKNVISRVTDQLNTSTDEFATRWEKFIKNLPAFILPLNKIFGKGITERRDARDSLLNFITSANRDEIDAELLKNAKLLNGNKKFNEAVQEAVKNRLDQISLSEEEDLKLKEKNEITFQVEKMALQDEIANLMEGKNQEEIRAIEEKYSEMKMNAQKYGLDVTNIDKKMAQEIAEVRAKDNKNLEKSQKEKAKLAEQRAKEEKDALDKREKEIEDSTKYVLQLNKESNEQIAEENKKAAERQANIDQLLVDSAIRDRQRQYEAEKLIIESTAKNEKDARFKIFELNKRYIDEDIAATEQLLLNSELSTEKRIELENQLAELNHQNKLLDAEEDKKLHDEKLARQKELVDGLVQLGSKIFEFTIANTNAELSALEEKNKKGIISEQEFNKKKAELELKKAKQERNKALFEIAINTATAISEANPDVPLMILAGIIGAIQAATVLSKPLPKYWTGTKNAEAIGIAGDRGRELATLTTGENILFEKPTLFADKKFKGMHIRTNSETERIMSATEHSGFSPVSFSDSKLLEKLDRVEKAITSKPVGIFQNGNLIGTQSPTHREIYVNRLKYGK